MQADSRPEPARLSRCEVFVLPLLSVATALVMFVVAEVGARVAWPAQESDACSVGTAAEGLRLLPNCTSRTKIAEGLWTVNHYNGCGYRGDTPCGPKPAGSLRIVLLGSSVPEGMFIPYEQTLSVRVAKELQGVCNKRVDLQNLAFPQASPIFAYRRLSEALALKPDVVLFVLTPFDLEEQIDPEELQKRNDSSVRPARPAVRLTVPPFKRLEKLVLQSRAVLIAQHYLFSDEDTFLRLYLVYGDKADFLRTPLSTAWQKRFADMDVLIADMAERTRAAGATLVVMPVPSRAEAALLSTSHPRPHIDAAAFGRELEQLAAKHGTSSIDLMNTFKRIPKAEDLFYVVDGHLTPEGHKVIAHSIVESLVNGSIPAFAECAEQKKKS